DDIGTFGLVADELIDFGDGAVIDRNFESVVVHVEDQVLAHDGESDQSDIASFLLHSFSCGIVKTKYHSNGHQVARIWIGPPRAMELILSPTLNLPPEAGAELRGDRGQDGSERVQKFFGTGNTK